MDLKLEIDRNDLVNRTKAERDRRRKEQEERDKEAAKEILKRIPDVAKEAADNGKSYTPVMYLRSADLSGVSRFVFDACKEAEMDPQVKQIEDGEICRDGSASDGYSAYKCGYRYRIIIDWS